MAELNVARVTRMKARRATSTKKLVMGREVSSASCGAGRNTNSGRSSGRRAHTHCAACDIAGESGSGGGGSGCSGGTARGGRVRTRQTRRG